MTDISPLIPSSQLPLWGKRILVTAPRNYAIRFAAEIARRGGFPLLMPTIETRALSCTDALDDALQHLPDFDWIAFTSRNSIEAVYERMQALHIPLRHLDRPCSCAIAKDAERLAEFGLSVDLIPGESSPGGIVAELGKVADIEGQNILVPVPEIVGFREPEVVPNFIAGLENLGLQVTRVNAYTTAVIDPACYQVELELLKSGKLDAIAFSSSAEIEALLTVVSPSDLNPYAIACFGPYTAHHAKTCGLNVAIVARDYSSFVGFATEIAAHFQPVPALA
ncbi:uroporphyrinogen-III synthase [Oxynema sp. CENA135]|jgi:uroporphyrinogen-III synthase|uniref:uroporphyrinogen-III synthase n=1 Tax=Oxynema sp. CENA135 TaxID=984206 RepID=UPI001F378BCA|nr:uroporphyrinogen-III synthase [Oxynema sp. CENA135]